MLKKKSSNLVCLIPSFNELDNLKVFIKKLSILYDVIVIDDCSTDNTSKWLKENKIHFIRNKKNLGYELSTMVGIKYIVKKFNYSYLVTLDGDGQHNFKDIKKLIKKIKLKKKDLIICNRLEMNRLLEYLISVITFHKFQIKDLLSGFRIFNLKSLKKINSFNIKKYFLVDLIMLCRDKNLKIDNCLIKTKPRIGSPRIGNALNVNLKLLKILFYLILK